MPVEARDFRSGTVREGDQVQELLTVRRVPMYLVLLTFLLDLIFSVTNNGWLYGLPFFRSLLISQDLIEPDLLANILILLLELIVILGVMVGFIVIALFLPLVALIQKLGGGG